MSKECKTVLNIQKRVAKWIAGSSKFLNPQADIWKNCNCLKSVKLGILKRYQSLVVGVPAIYLPNRKEIITTNIKLFRYFLCNTQNLHPLLSIFLQLDPYTKTEPCSEQKSIFSWSIQTYTFLVGITHYFQRQLTLFHVIFSLRMFLNFPVLVLFVGFCCSCLNIKR